VKIRVAEALRLVKNESDPFGGAGPAPSAASAALPGCPRWSRAAPRVQTPDAPLSVRWLAGSIQRCWISDGPAGVDASVADRLGESGQYAKRVRRLGPAASRRPGGVPPAPTHPSGANQPRTWITPWLPMWRYTRDPDAALTWRPAVSELLQSWTSPNRCLTPLFGLRRSLSTRAGLSGAVGTAVPTVPDRKRSNSCSLSA
jgi:hypothetical protein